MDKLFDVKILLTDRLKYVLNDLEYGYETHEFSSWTRSVCQMSKEWQLHLTMIVFLNGKKKLELEK